MRWVVVGSDGPAVGGRVLDPYAYDGALLVSLLRAGYRVVGLERCRGWAWYACFRTGSDAPLPLLRLPAVLEPCVLRESARPYLDAGVGGLLEAIAAWGAGNEAVGVALARVLMSGSAVLVNGRWGWERAYRELVDTRRQIAGTGGATVLWGGFEGLSGAYDAVVTRFPSLRDARYAPLVYEWHGWELPPLLRAAPEGWVAPVVRWWARAVHSGRWTPEMRMRVGAWVQESAVFAQGVARVLGTGGVCIVQVQDARVARVWVPMRDILAVWLQAYEFERVAESVVGGRSPYTRVYQMVWRRV